MDMQTAEDDTANARSEPRDSFFLLANVTPQGQRDASRVRVRNLSDGGMMGEGALSVRRGERLAIDMRGIARVEGTIAWVEGQRFGVAFDTEIDSDKARQPVDSRAFERGEESRELSRAHRAPPVKKRGPMRKV